jgi:lysophospholipase L1-like esterase
MPDNDSSFEYSNLSDRPVGYFVRISSRVLAGVRQVQEQVVPFAEAWQQSNVAAIKETGPLWVVLGDSMSQGIGASAYDKGYVGQLHTMLNATGQHFRVLNLSVSGCRVSDVLNRQIPALELLQEQPALVTVLIGSNDMVSRKYRKHLANNYQEMLEQLPHGTILASPFGDFGLGRELNALIKREAAKHHFTLIDNDLGVGLGAWKGKLAADHFHPNDLGYKGLAELFYDGIQASLKQ